MPAIETGSMAPELQLDLPDAEGVEHNLADALKRGPVLLGIYKSSCAASKAMMPMLERLYQRYGDQGLSVYGIAQDSPNITRSFARRTGITYPILVEGEEYPISQAFDIFATPTIFLIHPDGRVAYTTMGFLRDQLNEVGEAVAATFGQSPEIIVADDEDDIPRFVPG